MEVFRTRPYLKSVARLLKLGAAEADIATMEAAVAQEPQLGVVIRGSGGLRKARFSYGDRGKRGGGRVVYYAVVGDEVAYLLVAYAKADRVDLTAAEKKSLKALVQELTR